MDEDASIDLLTFAGANDRIRRRAAAVDVEDEHDNVATQTHRRPAPARARGPLFDDDKGNRVMHTAPEHAARARASRHLQPDAGGYRPPKPGHGRGQAPPQACAASPSSRIAARVTAFRDREKAAATTRKTGAAPASAARFAARDARTAAPSGPPQGHPRAMVSRNGGQVSRRGQGGRSPGQPQGQAIRRDKVQPGHSAGQAGPIATSNRNRTETGGAEAEWCGRRRWHHDARGGPAASEQPHRDRARASSRPFTHFLTAFTFGVSAAPSGAHDQ